MIMFTIPITIKVISCVSSPSIFFLFLLLFIWGLSGVAGVLILHGTSVAYAAFQYPSSMYNDLLRCRCSMYDETSAYNRD
jgi:hypothetical protein